MMTYNFGNVLRYPGRREKSSEELDILDLPQVYVDRYGIRLMEFQYDHLPFGEPAILSQLQARIQHAGARISQINLELQGIAISASEAAARQQTVTLTMQAIDRCNALGSPRLMINQGKLTRENMDTAADALKRILDHAEQKAIRICMEDRARAQKGRDVIVNPVTYPPAVLPPEPRWVNNDATRIAWKSGFPFVMAPEPPRGYTPSGREWAPDAENMLLVELYKRTKAYANIDVGGMCVDTQGAMDDGIHLMMPYTSGQVHINWRDNPGWDLPTTLHTFRNTGFKGLYVIEARPLGDSYTIAQGLKEVILANM
jgi:hypothetical protein